MKRTWSWTWKMFIWQQSKYKHVWKWQYIVYVVKPSQRPWAHGWRQSHPWSLQFQNTHYYAYIVLTLEPLICEIQVGNSSWTKCFKDIRIAIFQSYLRYGDRNWLLGFFAAFQKSIFLAAVKMFKLRFIFHSSLFFRVQLAIRIH